MKHFRSRERAYRTWHYLRNLEDYELCQEWKEYENFKEWYEESWYETKNNESLVIKYNIIDKHAKIISPNNSILVPDTIAKLFVNPTRNKEKRDLPIGVSMFQNKYSTVYTSVISIKEKNISLGRSLSVREAFEKYKYAKEKYIKKVADEYKDYIPRRVYYALKFYKVEIDD